jgi:2-methylcitrate dehydratase PrpD
MMMSVTGRLCERTNWISPRRTRALPARLSAADGLGEEAIAKARQLVLDGVSVAVAGARIEAAPRILANYLNAQESKAESSALGFGIPLAPVPAAFLNATSMHVLDFEPM